MTDDILSKIVLDYEEDEKTIVEKNARGLLSDREADRRIKITNENLRKALRKACGLAPEPHYPPY